MRMKDIPPKTKDLLPIQPDQKKSQHNEIEEFPKHLPPIVIAVTSWDENHKSSW